MSEVIQTCDDKNLQDFLINDAICKTIGNALQRHYPGRKWYVDVINETGMATICLADVSMEYGYKLPINDNQHSLEEAAMRAGGQMLEMFRLSRERGSVGGEERLERDFTGRVVSQKTGL